MMAFNKGMLYYSALILLVFGIGNIDAQNLDCGGNYTTDYGAFTSPDYPHGYDTYTFCIYTISLPTISSITLNFETFELDRTKEDYVLITCQSNSNFAQKVYDWNANIPPISIPWCSIGRLYFYADLYRNYNYSTRGFKVHYQVSTKDCGNTVFTSSSGTISSPNYPQDYNDDENCTYSIWASEASSFTLNFKDFHLEAESDCIYDWVQIRCENSGYTLPKYCGLTLPKPAYITNCNKVLIWFRSDGASVAGGFSLQYSITPNGCGKTDYGGLSGIITSPNYPKRYDGMTPHCTYYLYPVGSVTLSFQTFDLEPFVDDKTGDYVKIDCFDDSSNDIDTRYFRGNSLPPMISYSICRSVRIYFYTNHVISGTGFNIKYQVNPLVAHSAITTAPNNITVDVGTRVQLNCTSIAIGYLPSWTLSTDRTDENTTVIASFCRINFEHTSQYYVVSGGLRDCSLVITSVTLAQAGIYTCIDVGLASSSSVVTVVDPSTTSPSSGQGQDDSNSEVIIIVLAVLLAICGLCLIGIAICFTARRGRETSSEEGQQNTNRYITPVNDSVETQATGAMYKDRPVFVLTPEYHYEHSNDGFDAYDT